MLQFLRKCVIPECRIFNLLRGVFFSNVRVQLVTSVPATMRGSRLCDHGHMRLRAVLKGLQDYYDRVAPARPRPPVLSQCSSIGNPGREWIRSLLRSCHGDRALPKDVRIGDAMHVVFPTSAYVRNSIIGTDRAGSLIFSRKVYKAKPFLREMLKRYRDAPGRETTLGHSKYCGAALSLRPSDECTNEELTANAMDLRREPQLHSKCLGTAGEAGEPADDAQL